MPSIEISRRHRRRPRGAILAALLLALALTGCVGVLAPMKLLLALALVALLGLSCSRTDIQTWTERCAEVDDCDDDDDEEEEDCDGYWEPAGCDAGEVVYACCPEGMACNYGWNVAYCEDGTCVDAMDYPEACEDDEEEEEICDGYWEMYCDDGEIAHACCPQGMACNYGMGMQICGDGTCVDVADGSDGCEEPCDGTLETYCDEGMVALACCPEGMACNYGMTMVNCGDGTCVDHPETCPE